MQFCMIPYNLLQTKAAYLDTGSWANKAVKEAKIFGEIEVPFSGEENTFNEVPILISISDLLISRAVSGVNSSVIGFKSISVLVE